MFIPHFNSNIDIRILMSIAPGITAKQPNAKNTKLLLDKWLVFLEK